MDISDDSIENTEIGYDTPIDVKSYHQKLVNNKLLCQEALNFFGDIEIVFTAKLNQPITWSGIGPDVVIQILEQCGLNFVAIPIIIDFWENNELTMSHQNLLLCQKRTGTKTIRNEYNQLTQQQIVYWDVERFEPFGDQGYGFTSINKLLYENFVKYINPHTRWWDSNQLVMQTMNQTFCQNICLTYALMRRKQPNKDKNEIKKYIMAHIEGWCTRKGGSLHQSLGQEQQRLQTYDRMIMQQYR